MPIYANWEGPICRLGLSQDGREFLEFSHRPLPLPFYGEFTTSHGDNMPGGNPLVGEVHLIEMVGDYVYGKGIYFDTPQGRLAAQLSNGALRHTSVGPGGRIEADVDELSGVVQFSHYEIGSLTQVGVPCFPEAEMLSVTLADRTDAETTAALVASGDYTGPTVYPEEAFYVPEPTDPLRWSEDDNGDKILVGSELSHWVVNPDNSAHGYLAMWGTCHMASKQMGEECVTPPWPTDNYQSFMQETVALTSGIDLPVGSMTVGRKGHADRGLAARATADFYDRTGNIGAYVRLTAGAFGIWASGHLNLDATADVLKGMHGPASGDWRDINGNLELIAALRIPNPGFPVPKVSTHMENGKMKALVAAGAPPTPELATDLCSCGGKDPDKYTPEDETLARSLIDRIAVSYGLETSDVLKARKIEALRASLGVVNRRFEVRK